MVLKGQKSLNFVHFAKGVPATGISHYEISISRVFGIGGLGRKVQTGLENPQVVNRHIAQNFRDGIDKSLRVWYYKTTHIVDLYKNAERASPPALGRSHVHMLFDGGRKEERL